MSQNDTSAKFSQNGHRRAALYARVSGDDRANDGRNLAGQIEMGRKYAHEHGLIVVAELAEDDKGASGVEIDLPQLNRALEMAKAHECDILVVREIDRLSRSLAKQLIVEEELKRAGVEIAYVLGEYPNTPEGSLMKNVKAAVAEYERLKIVERNVRGKRLKAKSGKVVGDGHAPYGYKYEDSKLVIIEEQAKIVRLIYTWYVVGDGDSGPHASPDNRKTTVRDGSADARRVSGPTAQACAAHLGHDFNLAHAQIRDLLRKVAIRQAHRPPWQGRQTSRRGTNRRRVPTHC